MYYILSRLLLLPPVKQHKVAKILFIDARRSSSDHTISSKLYADAEREEKDEEKYGRKSARFLIERQHENWTGEESTEDAVLRMLVDKYKPLRNGTIRTADEKLKQMMPGLNSALRTPATAAPQSSDASTESANNYALKDQPLLPTVEGHKPWHTTFVTPTHATSSVRYGTFPVRSTVQTIVRDEKTAKKEKDERRRTQVAGRLTQAKESTLDYRLGLRKLAGRAQANPLTLKGWKALVEERIESARREGVFDVINGRGKPLTENMNEKNPFIGREEFLMNRIVRRNGAAPPWVELQGELDGAIRSFREIVKKSWTRCAIRILTTENPRGLLHRLTLAEVARVRDSEWERRERSYHDAALDNVNALVRKYNGIAPYVVRRPYYVRSAELDKVYEECVEDIHRSIIARIQGGGPGHESEQIIGSVVEGPSPRICDVMKQWLQKLAKALRLG